MEACLVIHPAIYLGTADLAGIRIFFPTLLWLLPCGHHRHQRDRGELTRTGIRASLS